MLSDALGEVARGLENVEFACGIPHLLKGGFSEQASTGVDVYSIRQPLGVVAGITPFNFPAMVPMWMFANALACGNTFVLKPSEKDPSASMFLAELLRQAGLPTGCFNVVHGDKVAVDRILEHPDIAAVSFVGSTPIARYIYETGTTNGKRVQALGGAKNHMLVLPDADLDMAADAAVSRRATARPASGAWRSASCSRPRRSPTSSSPRSPSASPSIKVGPGNEPDSEMGPLITGEHRDKVRGYVDGAPGEGATVVVDGRDDVPTEGFFLNPTLLDNVKPGTPAYDDEIFGPVLSVVRVQRLRRRRCRSSTTTRTATASPSSPATAGRPASSSSTSRSAWSASTCRSRCRSATTASAAGRRACSATRTCTAPRASTSTPAARSSPAAGPTPRRARSTSASRRTRSIARGSCPRLAAFGRTKPRWTAERTE